MFRSGVVLFAVVSACAIARADGNVTNNVEARRHYDEGSTAYSLGDFTHAAEEYKAAYKAKPDPAFLYNIAQAYRLANDAPNALFFYRSFLHNLPDAPNRQEVEDRIAKLEAQLAARDAMVKQPPNTTIPPEGRAPAKPPVVESKPTVVESQPMVSTPSPAQPELVVTAAPPPKHTPVYKKWWLWTAVGVVVAGAAAGTAAALVLSKPSAPDSHFGTIGVYQ
jgi:outer membrane protein assembly factor BamD (BamD/ComL family)